MGNIRTSHSPAARIRAQLLEKYRLRGHQYSNLWLFYSPKTQRDWVATGDLHFDHAIWMESDPQVKSYDLSPPEIPTRLATERGNTKLDAVVQLRDARVEWRRIIPDDAATQTPGDPKEQQCERQAACAAGVDYRIVTEADIWSNSQLIFNWRRVVSFLAAVRDVPMAETRSNVALTLQRIRSGTLRDLLTTVDPAEHPRFLAALFGLHQDGICAMDLDQHALSLASRFWLAEESAR